MRSPSHIGRLTAGVALLVAACGPAVPTPLPTTDGTSGPSATATAVAPSPSPAPTAAATPIASPTPTPVPTPSPVAFSLMDFNIEYGGDEVDFDKVIEAIRLADPDVVALEEAEGNTRRVAEALGWPYVSVRSQLVSKLPLIDPPGAGGRYEYVEVAPGAVVAVSNVHLPSDPYGPYAVQDGEPVEAVIELERATRLAAVQERLDVLPGLVERGIPTFLTGDFNAPSHLDWTTATVGLRPHIRYPVPWPVSLAVEEAGFRDVYRELHPDPVADPGLTWWAGRPLIDGYPDPSEPQDRIDIIYAAGDATAEDIRIVGEAGGPQVDIAVDPWGTDHRGVVGRFTVTPGVPEPYVAVEERLVTVGEAVRVRYQGTGAAGAQLVVVPVDATGSAGVTADSLALGEMDHGTWTVDSTRLGPGDHAVRLVGADGGIVSASPFSVAALGARPVLTLDARTYGRGDPIAVSWRDAPGSRWDWIGIYRRGADPLVDSYLFYVYTGQSVAGSVVIDERGEGRWPLKPGRYEVHYLLDDGYTTLAHAPFRVTE